MSQGKLCVLCVKLSESNKNLYAKNGNPTKEYEMIFRYFDKKLLSMDEGRDLSAICLDCWSQIFSFHNFQQQIYEAQKILNGVSIKTEPQYQAEEDNRSVKQESTYVKSKTDDSHVGRTTSGINIDNDGELFTITELNDTNIMETKPTMGYMSLNEDSKSSSGIEDKEEPTITLPKIEINDVHSSDDNSQDTYEYEDPEYFNMDEEEELTEMEDASAIRELCDPLKTSRYGERKRITKPPKKIDDLIAQWSPSLKCEVCSELCSTYSMLTHHFHDRHPLKKCYISCCQQKLSRRYKIEDHIRLHLNPDAFKCEKCGKDNSSRYNLILHIRTFHSTSSEGAVKTWKKTRTSDRELDELIAQWMPNIECVVCKIVCPSLKLLQLHFRQTHPHKPYQIECCQRRFKRRKDIEEHIRIHIDPNAFQCNLCYKQFKEGRYLLAHVRSFHSKENEIKRKNAYQKKMEDIEMDVLFAHENFPAQAKSCLQCILCAEMSTTYSQLRQHFQAKHPQEKFYMLCCQQKLSLRYRIADHLRVHIDPNTFKCNMCDKQFRESKYLLDHKRTQHPGEIRNCEIKKTQPNKKAKSDKEIDEIISQWKSNLECVICGVTSPTLTLLQYHFKDCHPQKQFQIECCQRMFKKRYAIEEHVRLHINPDAYKCNLCGTRFSMRRNLLKHMATKHPSVGNDCSMLISE